MFELSIKENNELREFTTLEKQMFHEHVSNKIASKYIYCMCNLYFLTE